MDSNVQHAEHSESDRRADAMAFWEASGPALHTPVQDYLACRGILIEPPDCIRHHAGKNALVARVQAMDGAFSGIQRIYLTTDSRGTWKTGRFSLGPIKAAQCGSPPSRRTFSFVSPSRTAWRCCR
jgi:hypothetical protein